MIRVFVSFASKRSHLFKWLSILYRELFFSLETNTGDSQLIRVILNVVNILSMFNRQYVNTALRNGSFVKFHSANSESPRKMRRNGKKKTGEKLHGVQAAKQRRKVSPILVGLYCPTEIVSKCSRHRELSVFSFFIRVHRARLRSFARVSSLNERRNTRRVIIRKVRHRGRYLLLISETEFVIGRVFARLERAPVISTPPVPRQQTIITVV